MTNVRRFVDRFLAISLIFLMGAAVINVLWQVITRWIIGDPSSYTEELARYLLIWVGLLGSAYAAGKKLHLAIDLLPNALDGHRRNVLEIVIEAIILLFALSVMVVGGIRLMGLAFQMGQISAAMGIPLGYVYLVLPLSGFLIAFYAIASIYERIRAAAEREADVIEPERTTTLPID